MKVSNIIICNFFLLGLICLLYHFLIFSFPLLEIFMKYVITFWVFCPVTVDTKEISEAQFPIKTSSGVTFYAFVSKSSLSFIFTWNVHLFHFRQMVMQNVLMTALWIRRSYRSFIIKQRCSWSISLPLLIIVLYSNINSISERYALAFFVVFLDSVFFPCCLYEYKSNLFV